jgi:hypothetical protein
VGRSRIGDDGDDDDDDDDGIWLTLGVTNGL